MDYFNYIQFIAADIIPNYKAKIDTKNIGRYSLELIRSGQMYFGKDHAKPVIFSKPTVYWLHQDYSYQYGPVDQNGYEHYYVTFRGPRGKQFMEKGLQQLDPRGYLIVHQVEPLTCLFRKLVRLVHHQNPNSHSQAVIALEEMLHMLMENQRTYNIAEHHRKTIESVAKLIQNAPYENYDIKAAAKSAAVSEGHFRRLFRQYIGTAIGNYKLICKMRRAATDLERTNKTAQLIAYEAGYDDPTQFSKMFKKKIGIAPQEYRKSFRHRD